MDAPRRARYKEAGLSVGPYFPQVAKSAKAMQQRASDCIDCIVCVSQIVDQPITVIWHDKPELSRLGAVKLNSTSFRISRRRTNSCFKALPGLLGSSELPTLKGVALPSRFNLIKPHAHLLHLFWALILPYLHPVLSLP